MFKSNILLGELRQIRLLLSLFLKGGGGLLFTTRDVAMLQIWMLKMLYEILIYPNPAWQ